jgi:hypothetical protein
MKTVIKFFSVALIFALFSCNNDFLYENNDYTLRSEYAIFISPEWETNSYPVYCPNAVNNAGFSVTSAPEWLNITSTAGTFNNGMAYITCKATVNSQFAEIGVYYYSIILDVEGLGKYVVPVCYVNEGIPRISTSENLTIEYNNYSFPTLDIVNDGKGILIWTITEYPKWLIIDEYQSSGVLYSDDYRNMVSIPISYNYDYPPADATNGKIVIASNDEKNPEITIDVIFDPGQVYFVCYTNEIDFGNMETEQTLSFYNSGSGLLGWSVEDAPDWLTFSEKQGTVYSYTEIYLTLTCDRSKLPEGSHSETITLKTNDKKNPLYNITVKYSNRTSNSETVKAINGTVKDAWMDKSADILYLATSQPNLLQAYDTKTKTIVREINLDKAPNCFSVSEDGSKAVVGHNGQISYINLNNFTVETTEVDHIVFDIEWGEGNWCCYTTGQTSLRNLNWINVTTNEKYETPNDDLFGESIIKKIPNQNYTVASRLQASPSGIIVFDTKTKNFINYFHESIDNFWFSADGAYLFSMYKNVYRTSTLTTVSAVTSISPIDQLNYDSESHYQDIEWIDHSPTTNSLWVLRKQQYYDKNSEILQLEDNDYSHVKTYYYDDYYVTSINGIQADYPVTAHYAFANGDGTELIVVRNVSDGNAWSLEHIPVNN